MGLRERCREGFAESRAVTPRDRLECLEGVEDLGGAYRDVLAPELFAEGNEAGRKPAGGPLFRGVLGVGDQARAISCSGRRG